MMHIFPTGRECTSWADYEILAQSVMAVILPIVWKRELGVKLASAEPVFDEDDLDFRGDLRLAHLGIIEHPLPSLIALTHLVVHPNRDIAIRFADQSEELEIKTEGFVIDARELPFQLPSRPPRATPREAPRRARQLSLARLFNRFL